MNTRDSLRLVFVVKLLKNERENLTFLLHLV